MNARNRTRTVLTLAVVAMVTLTFTATSATAALITVTNHSFEGGTTGWTSTGGADPDGGWYSDPMPDGTWFAWTNANNQSHEQTLGDTLQADTTYALTVATGWRNDLQGTWPNYPGYRIELWAGGSMIAFDADTTNGGTGSALSAGEWRDVVATVTTGAVVTPGQALEIRLLGGQNVNGGGAVQTSYDNVRLDGTAISAIPEPSTLVLAALGVVGLIGIRRRRNR